MTKKSKIDHYTDKEALDFHINGKSGKIEVNSSKPLTTKRDLSLAYSPWCSCSRKRDTLTILTLPMIILPKEIW